MTLIVLLPCPNLASLLLLLSSSSKLSSSSSSSRRHCHPHPHHYHPHGQGVLYIYFCRSNLRPNNGITLPPRAPYSSHLPSILSYVADTYFWLVVVWKLICLRPFKAMVYFLFFFLCCSIFVTTMVSYFPHASRSSHLPSILRSFVDAFFLVGCCVSRCQSRAIQRQRCISYIYFFIV